MHDEIKNSVRDLFRERLEARRKELSLSQEELAKVCGLSQSSVSRYLKGERVPDLDSAAALARGLSCKLEWLAGMEADQEQAQATPGEEYVGPVTALEKAALTKTLAVLRSTGVRGSPAQALAVSIDAHYESVQYAAELGRNGGTRQQRVGESPESSARRRKAR